MADNNAGREIAAAGAKLAGRGAAAGARGVKALWGQGRVGKAVVIAGGLGVATVVGSIGDDSPDEVRPSVVAVTATVEAEEPSKPTLAPEATSTERVVAPAVLTSRAASRERNMTATDEARRATDTPEPTATEAPTELPSTATPIPPTEVPATVAPPTAVTAPPTDVPPPPPEPAAPPIACTGYKTCGSFATWREAQDYYEACGYKKMDSDQDGIACEGRPGAP